MPEPIEHPAVPVAGKLLPSVAAQREPPAFAVVAQEPATTTGDDALAATVAPPAAPRFSATVLAAIAARSEPQQARVGQRADRAADAAVLPSSTIATDAAPALAIAASPIASSPAATLAPPASRANPTPPGIDLASMVEAIGRARAEARPDAVTMTVSHAEFGPVTLRFEHRQGDLTVAMSSADPEFAGAVSAAAASDPSTGHSLLGGDNPARGETPRQDTRSDARGEASRGDFARTDGSPRQPGGDPTGQSRTPPRHGDDTRLRPGNAAPHEASNRTDPRTDNGIFA